MLKSSELLRHGKEIPFQSSEDMVLRSLVIAKVTSSSTLNSTYYSAINAFDGNNSTLWVSVGAGGTNNKPQWLMADLGTNNKQTCVGYGVAVAGDRGLVDWEFQGDQGDDSWVVLDARTATPVNNTDGLKIFSFANQTAYQRYRIHVTKSQSTAYNVGITTFELYGI